MPLVTKNYLSFTTLKISWGVSKGRDIYGYNICRLDDEATGKRYRCNGGGYDMIGTVFGQWLAENFQPELLAIKDQAHRVWDDLKGEKSIFREKSLYGMAHIIGKNSEKISLDGGCGISSMITIAQNIGLEVNYMPSKKGPTVGFYVELKK